jgi:hypothetical protein
MTWTRLSDDFADDCWTLSSDAFRLHTELHVWSNRKLLDCRIPIDELPRASRCPDALPELVETGYVSCDGETIILRHHAMYQRTREQVIGQQEVNRKNGARGGRPPKPGRETHSVSDSVSDSKTERDGTGRDRKGAVKEQNNAGTVEPDHAGTLTLEQQRAIAFGRVTS